MCQTKFCRACSKDKNILEFHKKQEYPDGRYPRCIECVRAKIYLPEKTCIVDNKKQCSKCKDFKDLSLFSVRKNRTSGVQSACKECRNSSPKNRDIEKEREWGLLKNYNLSSEEFEKILLSQNNCCAICGINQDKLKGGIKKHLCVDHCHNTGEVRGLLCDKCNRGIGLLGDNVDTLKNAVSYLENNV